MKLDDVMKKRIRIAYGLLLSALLILTAILFICSSVSIYKSGESPYTRESIGEAFSRIAPVVYITVSVTLLGAIMHFLIPPEQKKLRGGRSPRVLVEKLSERIDADSLSAEAADSVLKERRLRKLLDTVRIILLILSATLPLIYLLNPGNFPAVSGEYNAEILHGILLYLAFLLPLAIYELVYAILADASFLREYELLKEIAKTLGVSDCKGDEPVSLWRNIKNFLTTNEGPIKLGVRIALVGLALTYIVLGIVNGGMADVLNKAIKICTECIGLG